MTTSKAVSRSRKGQSPETPRKSPAGRQGAAQKPVQVKLTSDLLAQHAEKARNAADLARRCGVADDQTFRRFITHHSQGSRVLAAHRAKFMRDGDAKVYVEKRPERKPTETPDLSKALADSVKQVKRTRTTKAQPKQPSRSTKLRALQDELGESASEARASLRDMS